MNQQKKERMPSMWPFGRKKPVQPEPIETPQAEVQAIASMIDASPDLFDFCHAYKGSGEQRTPSHDAVFLTDKTRTILILVNDDGSVEIRRPMAFSTSGVDDKLIFDAAKRLSMRRIADAIRGIGCPNDDVKPSPKKPNAGRAKK